MMRSLFSGVAGLKAHQTKMDVLGNNIANVNTVGFKSSSVNFTDTFYQTMSSATGPNAETGSAGTNAKQIGLGSSIASITTNITEQGGTSTTNRALDIAINGESFLIVKSAGATYFTKSGALNVDPNGTLYCTTNGATVQGWMYDETLGDVKKDIVKDLTVMSAENMYYEPTATKKVTLSGNIDKMDKDLASTTGMATTFSFYDNLGQIYTAKMSIKSSGAAGTYTVELDDIYNEQGDSIFTTKTIVTSGATSTEEYKTTGVEVTLGGITYKAEDTKINKTTGAMTLTASGTDKAQLVFNENTGEFLKTDKTGMYAQSDMAAKALAFSIKVPAALPTGTTVVGHTFTEYDANVGDDVPGQGGVIIDFSGLTQYSNGGVSNVTYKKGDKNGKGVGNVAGEMTGISIDSDGYVFGTYNNGSKKCLAQIAVATFANPSGLEAVGDSMFAQTQNSGTFDGVGQQVGLTGSFTVGALEMSNVDLAAEFTSMITTQRGFQANSRIITTSDSMLEELVNLKR